MKLTRNGQIFCSALFVAILLLGGVGFAQAKIQKTAYEEQAKQMQLYKDELNDAQAQIQENAKYKAMYECIAAEKDQLQKQVDELSK